MIAEQTLLLDLKPTALAGLRCVALHQYLASLVELDLKRIETRSFRISFRGPLAIQAAKKIPNYAKELYQTRPSVRSALLQHYGIRRKDELCMLPTAKILCVCDLVDCVKMQSDNPTNQVPAEFRTEGWEEFGIYKQGRYLWFLRNIRRLKQPVECRGYQGVWTLSDELITQVEAQL